MTDDTKKKSTLKLKGGSAPRSDRGPVRGMNTPKKRPTLAEAQAEREARAQRAPFRDGPPREGGGYGDRPPRRDDRGGFGGPPRGDRPPREGGSFGDRPPRRDDRGGFGGPPRGDRPPREGGSFSDRPPRRDDRGGFGGPPRGDRPPREGGSFSDRPPRRDDRGGFGGPPRGDRPPREGGSFSDRPPRRDDRGGFGGPPRGDRPPREGGGNFSDRPPRRDDRRFEGPREDRPPRVAPQRQNTEVEGERLSKVMADRSLASRREADEWIEAGWVRVNGKMAVLGQRVAPDVQIDIDPAAQKEQAQRVTILLHKPIGLVSGQPEDGYEPAVSLIRAENRWAEDPTVGHISFNPAQLRGLAPAGRLDIDSTGMLVFTQDGRIAKTLIGDDSDVEKEYLVRVARVGGAEGEAPMHSFPEAQLARLCHGLELDGVQLREAKVSWANEDQLRFVLREGRKRQIRRMCELVGLQVLGLKRVRMGRIPLSALPMGQWRYLGPWEKF